MNDLPSTEELLEVMEQQDKLIQELQNRLSQTEQENNYGLIEEQMQTITNLQSENSKLQTQINELLSLSEVKKSNEVKRKLHFLEIRTEEDKKNIAELEKKLAESEQNARKKAEGEISALKKELGTKLRQAEQNLETTSKDKAKIQDIREKLEEKVERKATEKAEKHLKELDKIYNAKVVGLKTYVGILTAFCVLSCILSLIRCEVFFADFLSFWKTFWLRFTATVNQTTNYLQVIASKLSGLITHETASKIVFWILYVILSIEIIIGVLIALKWILRRIINLGKEKAVSVWNVSVWSILLVICVWFGAEVRSVVDFNLFGLWLLLSIPLYLGGWYLHERRANRGY